MEALLKRPWPLPFLSKLGRANGNRAVISPERYLELAPECMEKVQIMTSLQLDQGLCQYLSIKLLLAIRSAHECARSYSPGFITSCHGTFKLLFRLAREVEGFLDACCNDQWIQLAIMSPNVSERVALLGYDLTCCRELLRNNAKRGSALNLSLTINELISGKEAEAEIVRLRASRDQDRLLEIVKAFIQSSNPNASEGQLGTYFLGRLTTAPTMCIPGSSSFWD